MPEDAPTPDQVLVALRAPEALVRVSGRATFKVSGALKQFGVASVESGCRRMVLDMMDCSGMDSTFMGVLAGLAGRLRRDGGEMALVNLTARTRGLVATLGLDHVVAAFEAGKTPDAYLSAAEKQLRLRELQPGREGKQETARTMLEAHEQLVEIDAANQPRFKDVLAYLREDLKAGGTP